ARYAREPARLTDTDLELGCDLLEREVALELGLPLAEQYGHELGLDPIEARALGADGLHEGGNRVGGHGRSPRAVAQELGQRRRRDGRRGLVLESLRAPRRGV